MQQCLLFDIEVNERSRIYAIGAVFKDKRFLTERGKLVNDRQLAALDTFGSPASFILGHNIIQHDIPRLKQLPTSLNFLNKPAIDTLYLSPLAFPENPYHRLVKNYKIVRDSVNDPTEDAILAGKVFSEQWEAFAEQLEQGSKAPIIYRSFMQKDPALAGTADALGAMGIPCLDGRELYDTFLEIAQNHACITTLHKMVDQLIQNTLDHPPLAYATAWLTVSGGNSILPPWVRHHFPEISTILHQLRETPCDDENCSYCRQHHNPRYFLQNFFGFDDFRPEPATTDGKSLQGEIVKSCARNSTVFATMPTGGGKSLCYLLPALMRYQRRNMLTIIISPLQALMKDQVDNFSSQTGTKIAAALYGMLTMPERGEVQEGIRLGDIGILLISPEQLRNHSFIQTVSQREIGAWVFDEAHCLSKWGHDFRPDYLYSIRFIREYAQKEKTSIPPVQCFTATAKKDVKSEISDIINRELGLRITHFEGGHERLNLHYDVWPVSRYDKNQTILHLLRAKHENKGSVVIYCSRRKSTEELAEFLQGEGYTAEAFHAGLEPSLKKRIQENFISGLTPIICATNAFGMGIDKDDVRLVIHADIPGSLENYLQEAGRAGRDRNEADCILIFTEQDVEGQFRLSSRSRLTKREIAQMLRGIRYAAKGGNEVILTSGELLDMDVVAIDPDDLTDGDTRVRTAISWLERSGYLERNTNDTRVFQGRPLVKDMKEAAEKIAAMNLSSRQKERWHAILQAFMEGQGNSKGFSADELARLSAFSETKDDADGQTESQRVIRTLNDMADKGLLSKETTLTAYIRYKTHSSSEKLLQNICSLENDFLKILQESAPDADLETPLELDLRMVNQQLVDMEHKDSTPHSLKLIVYGLSRDGKGLAGQRGSLTARARGNNRFNVLLHRDWQVMKKTVQIRQLAASLALKAMIATVPPGTNGSADLLVEFTLEDIVSALRGDLFLLPQLNDPLAAAERALTFMHEHKIITLQHGLAVFRQAMTINLNPEAKGRRYSNTDFSPLNTHYKERNFQIHVMNEYARRAIEKLSSAMHLVASYFNDDKKDFIKRFFPEKTKMLERATSEQSYLRIVDDLDNANQEKIVSASTEKNMLVLAGPGAGKTRIVAHRVAFLLRVKRIKPKAIFVLCFNRSAVMSLRRRIRGLVGDEMNGITTLTFHGLALRLTGRSLVAADTTTTGDEIDFSMLIKDAIRLLKGEADVLGFGDIPPRDALIGKFSHILVDEYQDIDAEQYELISLLTGKTEEDANQKLSILAVGDDDQNIYRFRGANVDFIRRFHKDYGAKKHYLIENYRSSANIIAAANALISHNTDRMKTDHPIRINKARESLPPGGNWQLHDPLSSGKVQILVVKNQLAQAQALREELRRLQSLKSDFDLNSCAILTREWKELDMVRSLFAEDNIPMSLNWGKSSFPSLTRIREGAELLEYLRENRLQQMTASTLLQKLPGKSGKDSVWQSNLRNIIEEWKEESNDTAHPVSLIEEKLYEAFADQNRAKNLHNGIFLSTVHSVKGLEFDHVFVLGGNWKQLRGPEMEEERRLYYVAMSRARETLHLFTMQNTQNLHTAALSGDFAMTRHLKPTLEESIVPFRYELLGMKELFIDFAGQKYEKHPTRRALANLQTDDLLTATVLKDNVELLYKAGVPVARLAKNAGKKWLNRLDMIKEIRVIAMVKRYRTDIKDQDFLKRCHGESWELPVVELKIIESRNRNLAQSIKPE